MYPHQASYQQPYAAGYPPQPYAQPQYAPPYFQQPAPAQYHGQQPVATQHYGQQPPAKRQKSTAIVTRYAPPPGYVPPPNQGLTGFQPQTAGYPQQPATHQHSPYQGYPLQGFQQYQQPQPGHGYNQSVVWQQQQQPAWPQPHQYQQFPQQVAQPNQQLQPSYPYQQNGQAQGQQQHYRQPSQQAAQTFMPPPQAPHKPSLSTTRSQPESMTGPSSSTVPQKRFFFGPKSTSSRSERGIENDGLGYGYDIDFEDEATSNQDTDASDPNLSLGTIVYLPAVMVKTPLPATFQEAELNAIAPAKPREGEEESISRYFTKELLHQVELSIRQSDEWESVKDDAIFAEFAPTSDMMPLPKVKETRNRPDVIVQDVAQLEPSTSATHVARVGKVEMSSHNVVEDEASEDDRADGDQAMELTSDEEDASQHEDDGSQGQNSSNILDHLEQALGANGSLRKGQAPDHSVRATSPDKRNVHRHPELSRYPSQPSISHIIRDEKQESLLAALGVEGSPKTAYPTPSPAFGSNESTIQERRPSMQSNPSRVGSISVASSAPPSHFVPFGPNNLPPPPAGGPQPAPDYDPWKAHNGYRANGRRGGSPASATSQHTAVGSDFQPDDDMAVDSTANSQSKPPMERTNSARKRRYDDVAESAGDGRRRQELDAPKKRRPPPKVSDAYRLSLIHISEPTRPY